MAAVVRPLWGGKEAKMNATTERLGLGEWLDSYRDSEQELLRSDQGFARWLEEEYVPVAGGWMY
jgi:hypothetical protein